MGGAIAVHVGVQNLLHSLVGLAVIDVVEGTKHTNYGWYSLLINRTVLSQAFPLNSFKPPLLSQDTYCFILLYYFINSTHMAQWGVCRCCVTF